MKSLTLLTLAALAVSGLARPAGAAEQPQDLVPMKVTTRIPLPQVRFAIPVNPPITVGLNTGAGEDPLLGQHALLEHALVRAGADGTPISITDGFAALTGSNGDALFIAWSARYVPPTPPYDVVIEGTYTVTGGRGRFVGATGSGVIRRLVNNANQEIIGTLEGMITAPRP